MKNNKRIRLNKQITLLFKDWFKRMSLLEWSEKSINFTLQCNTRTCFGCDCSQFSIVVHTLKIWFRLGAKSSIQPVSKTWWTNHTYGKVHYTAIFSQIFNLMLWKVIITLLFICVRVSFFCERLMSWRKEDCFHIKRKNIWGEHFDTVWGML